MDNLTVLRPICLLLALLSIIAGGLGMAASILFLGSGDWAANLAGAAGFVAGAILVGAGLLALTMIATLPGRSDAKSAGGSELP